MCVCLAKSMNYTTSNSFHHFEKEEPFFKMAEETVKSKRVHFVNAVSSTPTWTSTSAATVVTSRLTKKLTKPTTGLVHLIKT